MSGRRRLLGGANIRVKLLTTYFVLIFVPLGLLTLILQNSVVEMSSEQLKRSAGQSFQQAHSYLSYKLSQMITISDTIYFNTDVQDMLVKPQADYMGDVYQQTIDMQKLDVFLNNFKSDDLFRACLYVPSWFIYANQGIYMDNHDALMRTETYDALIATRDKVLWVPNEWLPNEQASSQPPLDVISLYRRVRNRNQISEIIGVIRLSIRQSSVDFIMSNADISKNGVVFLQNHSGQLVSRSSQVNLDRFMAEPREQAVALDAQWYTTRAGTERYLLMERPVSGTDWTMTCVIPYSELIAQSQSILLLMVVLAGSIGAAVYLVSYLASRSSMRRIRGLTEQMRRVHSGVQPAQVIDPQPMRGRDELDQMTDTFHFMLKRIDRLAEEQYQHGKEIKSAELRALQAQINPHFLYNTLDLINWKASEHGAMEIVPIVQALAQFYKLSLGRGSDIVPLRYELDHIRAYVHIQNQRFDQGIRLIVQVEDHFLEYRVPKIILQPLVENAILHGIMCKDDARGNILVSARLHDGRLILSVADDGVGMDEAASQRLLSNQDSPESGYGIYNIDHRLKLCYGPGYGLHFRFPKEGGVVAELHMPPEKPEA